MTPELYFTDAMAKPYDVAFRGRAVAAYEAGEGGHRELAGVFGIGYRTLHGNFVRKRPRLVAAVHGRFTPHHWLLLAQLLTQIDQVAALTTRPDVRAKRKPSAHGRVGGSWRYRSGASAPR